MFGSDKKTYVIIRAVAFVMVFIAIFAFLEALTYDHDKVYDGWKYVYDGDIDILIMGSSHVHTGFNAEYITEETGKSTVILSSGAQNIKQLYFNLVETLKYQKPEVIVVEEFSIIEDTIAWMKETDAIGLALSNLDGMKMSPLKLKAAFSTLGFDGYGVFQIMRESGKTERFIFALKHIKLAVKRMFTPKEKPFSETRGTEPSVTVENNLSERYNESLVHNIDKSFMLTNQNIKYMDKVIELCKENNIKLEFIKTPLIKNQSSISGHYAIEKHLEEQGYDINAYNLMDKKYNLGMELTDYADINHVSESGMKKVSDWFIEHIKATID